MKFHKRLIKSLLGIDKEERYVKDGYLESQVQFVITDIYEDSCTVIPKFCSDKGKELVSFGKYTLRKGESITLDKIKVKTPIDIS